MIRDACLRRIMGSSDHETVWRSSLRRSSLHRIPTPNAEAVEGVDDGQDSTRRVALLRGLGSRSLLGRPINPQEHGRYPQNGQNRGDWDQ